MDFSDISQYLAPYLRRCPSVIQEQEFLRTWRNFCKATEIVTWDDSFNWVADQLVYSTTAYPGYTPTRVTEVSCDDIVVDESCYSMLSYGDVVFDRDMFDAGDVIDYTVVCIPSLTCSDVMDLYSDQCSDALIDGTLAALCSDQGKPWFDPATATKAQMRYTAEVNRHKRLKSESGRSGDVSITPRLWI